MSSGYVRPLQEWVLQPNHRLFWMVAVSNDSCDQVDQEVDRASMPGMLDLTDVFELISDGLYDSSFAKEDDGDNSE